MFKWPIGSFNCMSNSLTANAYFQLIIVPCKSLSCYLFNSKVLCTTDEEILFPTHQAMLNNIFKNIYLSILIKLILIQSPQVVCSMILEMYNNQKSCSKIALNNFWGKKLFNKKYGGFLQWDCSSIKINYYTGNIIWAPLALKGYVEFRNLWY